jgi:hypothetical protein
MFCLDSYRQIVCNLRLSDILSLLTYGVIDPVGKFISVVIDT